MGKKAHKAAPYMCGVCKTGFNTEQSARDHIRDKHPRTGGVGLFHCIDRINGPEFDDEPSYAERTIAAQQARDMGEHTDDAWLLGE